MSNTAARPEAYPDIDRKIVKAADNFKNFSIAELARLLKGNQVKEVKLEDMIEFNGAAIALCRKLNPQMLSKIRTDLNIGIDSFKSMVKKAETEHIRKQYEQLTSDYQAMLKALNRAVDFV